MGIYSRKYRHYRRGRQGQGKEKAAIKDPFRKSGLILLVAFSAIMLTVADSNAFEEFASTLNPVGSGARATGMGGAFIGVADDATAASWNPAGLIQLEKPEISVVYSYFQRTQSYTSPGHREMENENTMDSNGINYASVALPFVLFNRNMIISLNYQRLYEMNKDVKFKYFREAPGYQSVENVEFIQDGFLYALSPAMAVQVTPELSLGATINFWDNDLGTNGWVKEQRSLETGTLFGIFPFERRIVQSETVSFKGTNFHFGFLWAINGSLTLGGVYKTPFNADVEKKKSFFESTDYPTIPPPNHSEFSVETTEYPIMRMPPAYGLGLSYRHSDSLTVAFDVYWTEWSRFVTREGDNNEKNPLTGADINDGRLKDTIQVRTGTEYLFIQDNYVVPVRFGLLYDPDPATGHLDDYFGFSFGTGFASGRMVLDAAYQYRKGDDTSGDIPGIVGLGADVDQHLLMMSAILYLGD
jgi:long-subunit fatty acid transport protein